MKYLLTIIVSFVLVGLLVFCGVPSTSNSEYLRIHIRANSNASIDQAVKYEVKDAVVDFLIPILSNCETKAESIKLVSENLKNIERVAESVLVSNNFYYSARAKIKNEEFPTRSYGDLTLDSGFYDALILELGDASGENWWCVVYPPLCFVNGSTTVSGYKSRIIEILNSIGIYL